MIFQGLLEFKLIQDLIKKEYNRNLILSAIIFNGEYLAYNVLIAYKDSVYWVEKLNSRLATLIFVASIAILLITTLVKNKYRGKI